MELVSKLEKTVLGWVKNVPHLPLAGQKWLATNVWWIVLIGAIVSGLAALVMLGGVFTIISLLGSVSSFYYVTGGYTTFSVVSAVISLVFVALIAVLLGLAVKPLKEKQKKGWVILFLVWILDAVSVVINAVLTMSVFGFIFGIIFGAIFVAIGGYFIFEIHSQFSHNVKITKTTNTAKTA
jgi:hypothetical protein